MRSAGRYSSARTVSVTLIRVVPSIAYASISSWSAFHMAYSGTVPTSAAYGS